MKKGLDTSEKQELRSRAEEQLAERSGPRVAPIEPDALRMLHELQVHQIELEMQNEELESARAEIEAGLKRYIELFDFAPIGYFGMVADGTIQEANLAAARMLGIERQRLFGLPLHAFVSERDRQGFKAFVAHVMSSCGDQVSETCDIVLSPPGMPPRDAHLTASVVELHGPPLVLIAVEDVTARKVAEEQVREEGRHKDDFLAMLSHELRNPLAPITNSLFVIEHAAAESEALRKARAVIARQVEHLTRIVDDLLDVTRIAHGKLHLRKEPVEMADLVRRTIDDHRALFDEAGLKLTTDLPSAALWTHADPTRMAQVLGNLLSNALKFTPPGGTVNVALRREDSKLALSIRDNGVGIAPEVCTRLFEPFRQAPQTLDRTRGGLGLGLATAKGLVELHRGSIEVASEGIGKGASFTLRLPLITPPSVSRQSRPSATRKRRVLIIEDSIDAAESLRDVLELGGHEVRVAHDGQTGIRSARELKPDVVLCDLGLPGMDGYQVARAFRADPALADCCLVALSGYVLPQDIERSREAGFDRHEAKPLSIDALRDFFSDSAYVH